MSDEAWLAETDYDRRNRAWTAC